MEKTKSNDLRADILAVVIIFLTISAFHLKTVQGKAVFPFDYEGYHYPLLHFIGDELSNGRFPLYDPYVYSGLLLYLNTQASLFYPLHLLFLGALALFKIEPSQYLINLLGVGHFILGGIFFYFFARHYRIRRVLAVVGAVLYSLNGHVIAQSQHMGVIEIYGWAPLLFLLGSKFMRKPEIRTAVGLSLIIALMITIGFLPLVAFVVTILFMFLSLLFIRDRSQARLKLTCLLFAAGIALCLTAAVTVPLLTADQPMEQLGIHGPLPPSILKTLWLPNVFRTLDYPMHNSGPIDPTASYLYSGLTVPFFALVGLFIFWKKSSELAVPFILSALCAFYPILISSGLYSLSPSFALLRPITFLYIIVLFGLVLALQAMEHVSSKAWAIASIILIQASITILPMVHYSLTPSDIKIIKATTIVSLVSLVVLILKRHSIALVGILMAGHLFVVNLNCPLWTMPNRPGATTPRTVMFGDEEILRILKLPAEPHRVAVDQKYIGGPWNAGWRIWRIESIGGFEPIRSQKYMDRAVRELSDWHTNRLFNVVHLESPLLNLMNVRYFVTSHKRAPTPLSTRWRQIYQGTWDVYENLDFQPRYAVVASDSVRMTKASDTADYYPATRRAGFVESIRAVPGNISFAITVQPPEAFLFIGERNYRGWEITVDGQRVEPMTVDELFMGIPVVQGRHEVELHFRMPYRFLIMSLTIFGICLAVAGFFIGKPKAGSVRSNSGHDSRF
jgi:hypothetical protein